MWTSFLQGLGSRLADRWVIVVLTPASVFWGLGLVALLWHDDMSLRGWGLASLIPAHARWTHVRFPQDLSQLPVEVQIALLVGGLLLIGTSAAVAQRLTLPTLRLAEGYWPNWLVFLRTKLTQPREEEVKRATARRSELREKDFDAMTMDQRKELARLDQQLRRSPQVSRVMPTKLGNVLRASEDLPEQKYGLNAVVCWPRLWLLLPEDAKKELTESRAQLNAATLVFLWALLFMCVWTVWVWWAIVLGFITAFVAYRGMVTAATIYGELVESTFDVHRFTLYRALRWPLPENPASERQAGEQITQYLYFGSDQTTPEFAEDS